MKPPEGRSPKLGGVGIRTISQTQNSFGNRYLWHAGLQGGDGAPLGRSPKLASVSNF